MKFLVDIQLPPRLCTWFTDHGHSAVHASELPNGTTLPDTKLWEYARTEGFILVSKDMDFRDLMMLKGAPPQLLYIGLGNCSNTQLLVHLGARWEFVCDALRSGASMVSVFAAHSAVYD